MEIYTKNKGNITYELQIIWINLQEWIRIICDYKAGTTINKTIYLPWDRVWESAASIALTGKSILSARNP